MREPLVSICILTYQHEPYIEDCIKGIIAQSYPNMELLFLDDASTDGTWNKIEQYHEVLKPRFVRVEWIRHDHNSGNVAKNVNEMLKWCRGTYIKSIAGDDCLCPGYIEKMTAFLEEHEEYVMAYCNEYIIPDKWHVGDPLSRESWFRFHRPPASEKVFDRLLLGNYIPSPTMMIRRNAFEKYGYHDESIRYEDYDMLLRLSRRERFGFINEKLVSYRSSATGLSHTDTRQKFIFMYNETVKVLKKHLRYVNREKRQMIIEHFLTARISEMKKKKWYDLALIFWIKRRRLCRRNMKKIVL